MHTAETFRGEHTGMSLALVATMVARAGTSASKVVLKAVANSDGGEAPAKGRFLHQCTRDHWQIYHLRNRTFCPAQRNRTQREISSPDTTPKVPLRRLHAHRPPAAAVRGPAQARFLAACRIFISQPLTSPALLFIRPSATLSISMPILLPH